MSTVRESPVVCGMPWQGLEDGKSAFISRGFVILPHIADTPVYCDECKDPLPLVARWSDSTRRAWAKYALPIGEEARAVSRIYYSIESDLSQETQSIPIGGGMSRSLLDEYLEVDSHTEVSHTLKKEACIRDLIDTHVDFINDLSDKVRSKPAYWESNCGGVAVRSLYRSASCWIMSDDHDEARLALIVKLARDISRVLTIVCASPRVVLRRSREFQKISKIQEIDPACMRWLARQPGRDIYERAGARQQLLGVVRKEDTDTLENRVVRDLLHRARIECANYLSLYREYRDHYRVKAVAKFRSQIVTWEKSSEISKAKPLTAHVQPNYVLLHELKYKKLWAAYVQLLSQQKHKDDIWKWRDRTFSESCELAVLSQLRDLCERSPLYKSDILFRPESLTGRFLDRQTQIGPGFFTLLNEQVELIFCPGHHANRCPFIHRDFYPLAADFFIVTRFKDGNQRTIPVWCLLEIERSTFEDDVGMLETKLQRIGDAKNVFPLLMLYNQNAHPTTFFGDKGAIVSLSLPLNESASHFKTVIRGLVGVS